MTKIKGGSVRFLEESPDKTSPEPPSDNVDSGDVIGAPSGDEVSEEILKVQREFIKPAVCLVCAKCISVISEIPQEEYSRLLLTLIRLYSADSSFSTSLYR